MRFLFFLRNLNEFFLFDFELSTGDGVERRFVFPFRFFFFLVGDWLPFSLSRSFSLFISSSSSFLFFLDGSPGPVLAAPVINPVASDVILRRLAVVRCLSDAENLKKQKKERKSTRRR